MDTTVNLSMLESEAADQEKQVFELLQVRRNELRNIELEIDKINYILPREMQEIYRDDPAFMRLQSEEYANAPRDLTILYELYHAPRDVWDAFTHRLRVYCSKCRVAALENTKRKLVEKINEQSMLVWRMTHTAAEWEQHELENGREP